ncbi:MAG: hypothetical protein ACK4YM_09900 [Novosphingobium sp.]
MKRSVITLALAALVLGGCSGKAKNEDAAKPAAQAGKKGDKKGAQDKPHVNPWASDAPADTAAAAPAPVKEAKKAAEKEQPKANPWAKDAPPGTDPAEPATNAGD